ncbi:MAG: sirohydrochlorin chelatase, partial [Acidimicrobiales bacterium]
MIERPALLLIGHGTRSEVGVAQYFQLAQAIRDLDPELTVGCGFIELVKPTLDEAIDELVVSGVQAVVGVPLVLLGAGHLKNDGPVALAGGRLRHPEVSFSYARELGLHPHVLDVVDDRIAHAVQGLALSDGLAASDGGAETVVVLVGRGSSDPDANADLYKAARLLSDSRGLPPVEPAFVSLAP